MVCRGKLSSMQFSPHRHRGEGDLAKQFLMRALPFAQCTEGSLVAGLVWLELLQRILPSRHEVLHNPSPKRGRSGSDVSCISMAITIARIVTSLSVALAFCSRSFFD